jgi:hypothetical protein
MGAFLDAVKCKKGFHAFSAEVTFMTKNDDGRKMVEKAATGWRPKKWRRFLFIKSFIKY